MYVYKITPNVNNHPTPSQNRTDNPTRYYKHITPQPSTPIKHAGSVLVEEE